LLSLESHDLFFLVAFMEGCQQEFIFGQDVALLSVVGTDYLDL